MQKTLGSLKMRIAKLRQVVKGHGVLSDALYVLAGVLAALVIYSAMGFALSTPDPLVTVVSCSMYPTLNVGDMLVLRGVPFDRMEAGDIIVFTCPSDEPRCIHEDKLIVHRIHEVNEDGTFRTKGDNAMTNNGVDPWTVQPEWISGRTILRLPYLGYPRIGLSLLLGEAPLRHCE